MLCVKGMDDGKGKRMGKVANEQAYYGSYFGAFVPSRLTYHLLRNGKFLTTAARSFDIVPAES